MEIDNAEELWFGEGFAVKFKEDENGSSRQWGGIFIKLGMKFVVVCEES